MGKTDLKDGCRQHYACIQKDKCETERHQKLVATWKHTLKTSPQYCWRNNIWFCHFNSSRYPDATSKQFNLTIFLLNITSKKIAPFLRIWNERESGPPLIFKLSIVVSEIEPHHSSNISVSFQTKQHEIRHHTDNIEVTLLDHGMVHLV